MTEEGSGSDIGPYESEVLEQIHPALRQFLAGGIAGIVAKTATAPLSRLTILFQVHSLVSTKPGSIEFAQGTLAGLRKVVEREGVWAFWKGNGTSVLHRFPYSAINFAVFERAKPFYARLLATEEPETMVVRLLAGATAGAVATSSCYPLDLVRTRLATQHISREGYYRGISHALLRIAKEEGAMGLYRGLGTSLCVQVPNLAMSYSAYGTLKEKAAKVPFFRDAATGEANTAATLGCGAASGVMSSLVTYPLDVVRRRMQIEGLHVHGRLRGPMEELRHIFRSEGLRGLYRGLTPEVLKCVPMVCLTFATYEVMQKKLGITRPAVTPATRPAAAAASVRRDGSGSGGGGGGGATGGGEGSSGSGGGQSGSTPLLRRQHTRSAATL